MDSILVITILVMYFIQAALASSESLNYLHIGILMMVRAYLKLPFAIALIQFILKVRQIKHQN